MIRLVLVIGLVSTAYGWGRIVGGKDANIEDHNYQVSLRLLDKHRGGGLLLTSKVVLTAAHCIHGYENSIKYFSVQAGSSVVTSGGQVRPLETMHKHKDFYRPNYDYDVAILILKEPFDLSSTIGIIELVPKNLNIPIGTLSVVTGWGATTEKGPPSERLQSVKVPKLDWDICNEKYDGDLTDRMTCWGFIEGEKDACQGDSGGPLVIYNKDGTPQLAGVVSWGEGCARAHFPGVYVNVQHAKIYNFITQYI